MCLVSIMAANTTEKKPSSVVKTSTRTVPLVPMEVLLARPDELVFTFTKFFGHIKDAYPNEAFPRNKVNGHEFASVPAHITYHAIHTDEIYSPDDYDDDDGRPIRKESIVSPTHEQINAQEVIFNALLVSRGHSCDLQEETFPLKIYWCGQKECTKTSSGLNRERFVPGHDKIPEILSQK